MGEDSSSRPWKLNKSHGYDREHYRSVRRNIFFRLVLYYLLPVMSLAVIFGVLYSGMVVDSRQLHLKAIAENQANTLSLFLAERLVNLSNVIDDPSFPILPSSAELGEYLETLKKDSPAFVDIGFFDPSGVQVAYAGPYTSLEKRSYATEGWYVNLSNGVSDYVITDVYLGFRERPHFTIAVSRTFEGRFLVLRATLDPGSMYDYIGTLEGAGEVHTSIVNPDGRYQLVPSSIGAPLEASYFVPPQSPRIGVEKVRGEAAGPEYAYSWLRNAEWALIVQSSENQHHPLFSGFGLRILFVSILAILVILTVISWRSGATAKFTVQSDETRVQLGQAAKLASVGELAAGIAHEINNPLAAISEEAGLMKDLLSPEFAQTAEPEEMISHLDSINESVFRCRDITRKLLGFVRSDSVNLRSHDLKDLIDDVVDGLLVRELAVSNIEMDKWYGNQVPCITTDGGQLQQVLLNILNNAVDAIGNEAGRIQIRTELAGEEVRIDIEDTGQGMTPEQLEKIFLPFYTTKEVGKGTGLGLSVSYGIIKDLGGRIEVESAPGRGSVFTIYLPVR
jgi:two-component system NtrC family sensor kinase